MEVWNHFFRGNAMGSKEMRETGILYIIGLVMVMRLYYKLLLLYLSLCRLDIIRVVII